MMEIIAPFSLFTAGQWLTVLRFYDIIKARRKPNLIIGECCLKKNNTLDLAA
jgi:hypothetical protein